MEQRPGWHLLAGAMTIGVDVLHARLQTLSSAASLTDKLGL